MSNQLLSPSDPAPYRVCPGVPGSPYLLTADHAGRAIPAKLGTLGLSSADLTRHIAWDIGIAGVCEQLARLLGAFLIVQNYSRLVIDCNRPLHVPSSIVTESEHTPIPGNQHVSTEDAELRTREIFIPYHRRIEAEFERREGVGEPIVYVAMHSFTPRFKGTDREWDCGVLYHRDARLAHRMLPLLREEGLIVGDNQPYFVSDLTDYGVPTYGEQRGHLHVELEIRQDRIAAPEQQEQWAARLARVIPAAAAALLPPA